MIESKLGRAEGNTNINNFTNIILNDLKSLTNSLRTINKPAAEVYIDGYRLIMF